MRPRAGRTLPIRVSASLVKQVRKIAEAEERTVRCVAEHLLEVGLTRRGATSGDPAVLLCKKP